MFTTFSEWVLYFALYSMIGWVCETIWCSVASRKLINRGFLGGPWCPIYGFGATIILLATQSYTSSPALVFLSALVSTSALEYFTGWLLEALFKAKWWDYNNRRFNIRGRVCLMNSLIFGLMGLGVTYLVHPFASGIVSAIEPASQSALAGLLIIMLLWDLLRSTAQHAGLNQRLEHLHRAFEQLELYQRDHGWYDAGDMPGSVARLRILCRREPGNQVAAALLGQIDAELNTGKSDLRLLAAYPMLRPREFGAEFTALKAAQQTYERAKRPIRAKLSDAWRDVKAAYKGITIGQMVWVFTIGSVLGYFVENLFFLVMYGEIVSRQGMIYGPLNQIYGFGAVLMVLLLTPFAEHGDGWLFIGGGIVGGLFEVGCSWVQQAVFGSVSWEYSAQSMSLAGGRTSVPLMICWGLLALLYMKEIYPRMRDLIARIPKRPERFFTISVAVLMALNLGISGLAVSRWESRLDGSAAENAMEVWLDDNYPNELLEEVYPSMEFVNHPKDVGEVRQGV